MLRSASERLHGFLQHSRVGYFSMEIALRSEIPTYAGGLGVLAGDTLRSAADLGIPLVGVTLASREGYFRQSFDVDGRQIERPDPWEPSAYAEGLPAKVSVAIDGRQVWIGGWLYVVEGLGEGHIPVVLLDTDLPENSLQDRRITHALYGGDLEYRLCQEVVLGFGGVRMLEALGFTIGAYHLNEGHSVLLALELLRRSEREDGGRREGDSRYDLPRVRAKCHFTTHTPVDAGHDRFPYELVDRVLGEFVDGATLRLLGGGGELNTTRLALNLSEHVNGVAVRHAETAAKLFPGYRVSAITNGIHPRTWAHTAIARVFDRFCEHWAAEPERLMRADSRIPNEEIARAHEEAKLGLLARVRAETGVDLDARLPLIGFARRMTEYKRPELLFADLDRLRTVAARQPFNVVLAGKAHPRDESGRRAVESLHRHARALEGSIRVAYLPNYGMDSALALVSGSDLWLNTPQPPLEASGTSGMKAALNGVPSLSVLDGWWLEGHIEGVTGWAIGDGDLAHAGNAAAARSLYDKLERVILPLFADRDGWLAVMKGAIARNASVFHSHRMMRRYAAEAYLPEAVGDAIR
jgi:starch phosphorylase